MIFEIEKLWPVIFTSFLPISELRGGIPLGIGLGLDPAVVIILSIAVNIFVFFPIFFGLKLFYQNFFSKIKLCRNFIEKTRKNGKPYVDKYGMLGLAIFVGIPFPLTGAYTGTILAWLLGLEWKKSFLSVSLGVVAAGILVSAVCMGIVTLSPVLADLLIKR